LSSSSIEAAVREEGEAEAEERDEVTVEGTEVDVGETVLEIEAEERLAEAEAVEAATEGAVDQREVELDVGAKDVEEDVDVDVAEVTDDKDEGDNSGAAVVEVKKELVVPLG